jgi:hypothetical protein
MKLSEAILLGSIGTPQAFCESRPEEETACALEAAALAIGVPKRLWGVLDRHWPWINRAATCPHRGECDFNRVDRDVSQVIWHLNDQHHWPRPQIAAWVATIEPQDTPVEAEKVEHDRTRV